MSRKTKILATVGPSSGAYEAIKRLVLEGANGFRLNFAHGTLLEKYDIIKIIREIEEELDRPIAIVADIPGRGPRIGALPKGYLSKGEKVILSFGKNESDNIHIIPVPPKKLLDIIDVEDDILLADGRVIVRVDRIIDSEVEGTIISEGEIRSNVSITVRHKPLPFPPLTERDKNFVRFAVKNDVDYIALSFVQSASDILELKSVINELGEENMKVIAKIEAKPAINNLDEILSVTDMVMVARGDLGVQLSLEEIPYLENLIIQKSLLHGKPVILATQVLESMIESPIPTRAEVIDIAVAVEKSVDAIMLSGETAIGKHPVQAVRWLRRIIERVEQQVKLPRYEPPPDTPVYIRFNRSIVSMAEYLDADIVALSTQGFTAIAISRFRTRKNIFIVTNNKRTYRQLALIWGINPILDEGIEINLDSLATLVHKKHIYTDRKFVIITLGWRRELGNIQEIRVEEL